MMYLDRLPSFLLVRIAGVPVRLDVTFAFVLFALFPTTLVSSLIREGALPPRAFDLALASAIKIGGTFASILVHELGHAAAARTYGVRASEIRIGGFYGLAIMPSGLLPRRAAIQVLLAGPFANVLLAIAIWLSLGLPNVTPRLSLESPGFMSPDRWHAWHFAVAWLFQLNVALAIFNVLPAFPLDGGRVANLILMPRLGFARATRVVAATGMVVAAWTVLGSGGYGFALVVIGFTLAMVNYGVWSGTMPPPED